MLVLKRCLQSLPNSTGIRLLSDSTTFRLDIPFGVVRKHCQGRALRESLMTYFRSPRFLNDLTASLQIVGFTATASTELPMSGPQAIPHPCQLGSKDFKFKGDPTARFEEIYQNNPILDYNLDNEPFFLLPSKKLRFPISDKDKF